VPQGSILGPILYTIYTCQFVKFVNHCKIHMYADDTQLQFSFKISDSNDAFESINRDLTNLVNMSQKHDLRINPKKSSVILFGNKNNRSFIQRNFSVSINNSVLPFSDSAKNLGVIVDCELRFKQHITDLLKKSYSILKMLYMNRQILNHELKKMLCNSLILSKFDYCDVVYHACLDSVDVNRIQVLQNACLRFIYSIRKWEPISHTLRWAGWLNMANRRILHSLCVYHRILSTETPPYLYNKITFRTDVHNLNLRHKNTITIPKHSLHLFKRSFSYRIPYYYNRIPNELRSLSQFGFKFKVKKLLCNCSIVLE